MLGDTALGLLEGRRPESRSAPLADPEYRSSYARVARHDVHGRGATSLLWMGMPEHVGFLGLAEAALHEEGLDDQAELVRCAARRLERSGRRRSCRARRPISSGAAACARLLNQAQADTVLA